MRADGIVSLSTKQYIHPDHDRLWQHMRKFWSGKILKSWLVRCWLTAEIKFELTPKSCSGKRWNFNRAVIQCNLLRIRTKFFQCKCWNLVWVDAEIVFEQSLKTSSCKCWIHVGATAVNFVVQQLKSLKSCACQCWLQSWLIFCRLGRSLVWVDETTPLAPASQLSAGTDGER